MMTSEQILAQILALETAVNSGATRVSYGDKSVEYRSLSEMRSLLDRLYGLLNDPAYPQKTRRTVAAFNGGFY